MGSYALLTRTFITSPTIHDVVLWLKSDEVYAYGSLTRAAGGMTGPSPRGIVRAPAYERDWSPEFWIREDLFELREGLFGVLDSPAARTSARRG
jgi:hypothetical protein